MSGDNGSGASTAAEEVATEAIVAKLEILRVAEIILRKAAFDLQRWNAVATKEILDGCRKIGGDNCLQFEHVIDPGSYLTLWFWVIEPGRTMSPSEIKTRVENISIYECLKVWVTERKGLVQVETELYSLVKEWDDWTIDSKVNMVRHKRSIDVAGLKEVHQEIQKKVLDAISLFIKETETSWKRLKPLSMRKLPAGSEKSGLFAEIVDTRKRKHFDGCTYEQTDYLYDKLITEGFEKLKACRLDFLAIRSALEGMYSHKPKRRTLYLGSEGSS